MDDEATPARSDTDWVRVQTSDGFTFLVRNKVIKASGTMSSAVSSEGGFAESAKNTYNLTEFRGIIGQKLLEYMSFKAHYDAVGPKEEIPTNELIERIPPEIVLELLLAADYMEV